MVEFNTKTRQKKKKIRKNRNTFNSISVYYEGWELILNAVRSGIFPIKATKSNLRLKILRPKQMLQRLPILLAQVNTGNTSENLLNEIRQIIYLLYWSKEITKKVYNNIMNSTKL